MRARKNVKIIEKPQKFRKVSVDSELGGADGVLVKSGILRFSNSFADSLRLKDGDAVIMMTDDEGWSIAVLPQVTSRSGYKVTKTPAGWQINCLEYRKQGLEEGLYLTGAVYNIEYREELLDCYPLEWVSAVR